MEDKKYQIKCIKDVDKFWKGYRFQKHGKGEDRTALLPFDLAAEALTHPDVFVPGADLKDSELLSISERHVNMFTADIKARKKQAKADKAAPDADLSGFVTKEQYNEVATKMLDRIKVLEETVKELQELLEDSTAPQGKQIKE